MCKRLGSVKPLYPEPIRERFEPPTYFVQKVNPGVGFDLPYHLYL